jgi:hypothetical protein
MKTGDIRSELDLRQRNRMGGNIQSLLSQPFRNGRESAAHCHAGTFTLGFHTGIFKVHIPAIQELLVPAVILQQKWGRAARHSIYNHGVVDHLE